MRCAYIVSRYPYVSHTFVLREVLALRARGVEISTVTVRRPDDADVIAPIDKQEMRSTHAILPTTAFAVVRAHARAVRRGPRAYARTLLETLRDMPLGARASAWQLFYFVEAIMFWSWLDEKKLPHVHAHHANVAADLAMIATRFGNRVGDAGLTWSFTIHGPAEFADVAAHKLDAKASRADAVVATSDHARSQILSLIDPEHHERVAVIHCGVEPAAYPQAESRVLAGEPLRLLSVGRLEARKGHGIVLEAVARLRRDGVAVELTLVGDGPERDHLERLVAELDIAEAVSFLGALGQDEVTDLYAGVDAFCLASFAEGMPIVLMEAMASGLPVVSTTIAGTPELVENGHNGLLVSPGRADELANALAKLAGDDEMRRRLGAAARKRIRDDYAVSDSAAKLERLFARLVGHGAAGRNL